MCLSSAASDNNKQVWHFVEKDNQSYMRQNNLLKPFKKTYLWRRLIVYKHRKNYLLFLKHLWFTREQFGLFII